MKEAVALFLAAVFTVSLCSATAWEPTVSGLKIENINIDMEMLPDARCHITATLDAIMEGRDWSGFPITGAKLDLDISRSGEERVTTNLEGEIRFTETALDTLPQDLLQLNAEAINLMISASGIEGRSLSELLGYFAGGGAGPIGEIPEGMGNIVVEDLSVTRFSWEGTALRFGGTCTLSGDVLASENLERILPVDLSASLNFSATTMSVTVNARAGDSSLDATVTATHSGGLILIHAEIEAYFRLPVSEDRVEWSPLLPAVGGLTENLSGNAEHVNLTVKVPENSQVGELPSGYEQNGYTYTWSGPEAAGAIGAFLAGGPVNISYEYVPPQLDLLPWIIAGAVAAVVVALTGAVLIRRKRR
ncbi:MAG: hypothetical protein QW567_02990 [Candidatus Hadarchaeales archaeon]